MYAVQHNNRPVSTEPLSMYSPVQQQNARMSTHRTGNCLWANKDQDCDDQNFEIIHNLYKVDEIYIIDIFC